MDTNHILLERFIRDHPLSAARTIEKLKKEEVVAFIDKTPVELSVLIITQMHSYKLAKCLELINPNLAVQLLEKIDVRSAELALRQNNEDFRNKVLTDISPKLGNVLRQKLKYSASTIGALMTPVILALRKEVTVEETIAMGKEEREQIRSQIYVINAEGKLEGIVKTHDLLFAEGTDNLSSIMKIEIPKLFADTPIESIANHLGWYEFQSIPVIDSSEKLIGTLNFEATQKKNIKTGKELTKDIIETSNALGELYRIGLTGFLQSVSK